MHCPIFCCLTMLSPIPSTQLPSRLPNHRYLTVLCLIDWWGYKLSLLLLQNMPKMYTLKPLYILETLSKKLLYHEYVWSCLCRSHQCLHTRSKICIWPFRVPKSFQNVKSSWTADETSATPSSKKKLLFGCFDARRFSFPNLKKQNKKRFKF